MDIICILSVFIIIIFGCKEDVNSDDDLSHILNILHKYNECFKCIMRRKDGIYVQRLFTKKFK